MKKLISLCLCFVICLCSTLTAFAAAPSSVSYKLIRTAAELAAIKGNGNYMLANDIDLSDYNWNGISSFSGTLNGGNYSILNMRSRSYGLFNRLDSGAKITNIRLKNASIVSQNKRVGGIVGYIPNNAKDVSIVDCAVYGEVISLYNGSETTAACGGIAGFVYSPDAIIKGCVCGADVQGNEGVGGIAGRSYGKITDCVSTASLSCSRNNHNYCSCPYDEINGVRTQEHNMDIRLCTYLGGIAGANYGSISNSIVCADSMFDESNVSGVICAINIKKRGKISDCTVINRAAYSDIPLSNEMTHAQLVHLF